MFTPTRRGALLGTLAASLAAGVARARDDPRVADTDRLLASLTSAQGPGAAVAVSLGGATVFSRGYGLADLEQGTPITPATVFHAASVSKQFTAFALMLLVAEGRLSLDDRLADHIPETAALGADLRLHHLLHHTGGLRDGILMQMAGWSPGDLETDAQMERLMLRQRGLNFAPGTRFQYTNGGYFLLARLVERLSSQSFAAFCKARIFDPLGMADTRFDDDPDRITPRRAQSYRPTREGFRRAPLNSAITGSTGLQTTIGDLLRWAAGLEGGTLGGPEVTALMARRDVVGGEPHFYAGGQERRLYRGVEAWGHGGRDAGFRAYLVRVPSARFAAVVLSNNAAFDMAKTAFRLADIWLADRLDPVVAPRPLPRPDSRRLAALAGTYELFPGFILTIAVEARDLTWRWRGAPTSRRLEPLPDGGFLLDPGADVRLEFAAPVNGRSPALIYRLSLNGFLDAPRIDLAPFDPVGLDLSAYVGRYASEELDTTYRLFVKDGGLVARHERLKDIPLSPYQPDLFASPEAFFGRVAFRRTAVGVVEGFVLSGAVAEGVRFVRIPDA